MPRITLALSLSAWALVAALAANADTFDAATFNWTDPANWNQRLGVDHTEVWTLRDPTARAYNAQAKQAGQFCVYEFRRGRRYVHLMIPSVSPACRK